MGNSNSEPKVKKEKMSIMKKMAISLISGITVGFIFLGARQALTANGLGQVWDTINSLLFADITQKEGLNAVGLFYIVGQLFMNGLQLAIVPLVLSSLSLALCSMANPEKLGRIAGRTIATFLSFYAVAAFCGGAFAYFIKTIGWFNVTLPSSAATEITKMEAYNPLTTVVNMVPSNVINALGSNNSILAVVVIAIVIGLCMNHLGTKADPMKNLMQSIQDIIQVYMDVLINYISPVAIFCMISRTFAIYGIEYLTPTLTYILATIFISLLLVFTMYPVGIFITTRLNPITFMKKALKIGMFAAATNSSAATLPLNTETCVNELGCSEEISSFVLPTGMTINMNGTTVMHMMAVTFIATSAGIDIQPYQLVIAALLSICMAMGTPAIPVAGTTMVFAVLNGLGFNSDLCMIGYALVLAMNYPPGMAVITLNVVGDAATNVIVNYKEHELDEAVYNQ
ncbi:MAG: dicarboxylate/amino acid:cation symporter [Eubacteriaceae bacterium]|nr:dicarboxylate/amino acid:cation symporter [Eubacteriaceae bacterium]